MDDSSQAASSHGSTIGLPALHALHAQRRHDVRPDAGPGRAATGLGRSLSALRVTPAQRDGRAELALAGELDLATVETLVEQVDALERRTTGDIVLDLAELAFIDSTGLRALITIEQSLAPASRRLVLRNPQDPVDRILKMTGLATHFSTD